MSEYQKSFKQVILLFLFLKYLIFARNMKHIACNYWNAFKFVVNYTYPRINAEQIIQCTSEYILSWYLYTYTSV